MSTRHPSPISPRGANSLFSFKRTGPGNTSPDGNRSGSVKGCTCPTCVKIVISNFESTGENNPFGTL